MSTACFFRSTVSLKQILHLSLHSKVEEDVYFVCSNVQNRLRASGANLLSYEEFVAKKKEEDKFKIVPNNQCKPKPYVLFIKGRQSDSTHIENIHILLLWQSK